LEKLKCDVLVVGGGPAGSTASRKLSQLGVDNILLEKDLSFQKPCGGGLMFSAYEEFDIPQSLIKKEVNSIKIVSPKLNEAMVDIYDYPLTIVNRCEFDAKLRELAKEAGSRLIEAKAYDISIDKTPTVFAKSGDKTIAIECRYIIASDGVNSTIRKKLLNQTPSRVLTYYIDIPEKETTSCQFWFGDDISPKHYSWIFPHFQGINVGLISDNKKEIANYFQNFLKKAKLKTDSKPRGYYIPVWDKEIYFEKGVFFVGDSASMVLPFTYEGIYYAMKSASLAVEAISKDNPSLYEESWKKLYYKKFKFLKILQNLFLNSDYFSEKLVKLYQNPKFQKAVVQYWIGENQPTETIGTFWKFIKVLIK